MRFYIWKRYRSLHGAQGALAPGKSSTLVSLQFGELAI
jgi:hypothetical protein